MNANTIQRSHMDEIDSNFIYEISLVAKFIVKVGFDDTYLGRMSR